MDYHIPSILAGNPRLRFDHDSRGWLNVSITPTNRSAAEYVEHVRHCLRTGDTVPHPRGDAERVALQNQFPEIAEHFADCGGQW